MFGITDVLAFLIGTVAIVLLPGPNSLYVVTLATQHGSKAAWRAALGIMAGDTILMVLSVTSVASMLKATPLLFALVKYTGAAYLAWLGGKMMFDATKARTAEAPAAKVDEAAPLLTALRISLLNPKAILFFISFFVQFVDPHYPNPALTFFALALIVQVCSVTYLAALIYLGAKSATQLQQHPRLAAAFTSVVGLLFVALGIKLALSSATN